MLEMSYANDIKQLSLKQEAYQWSPSMHMTFNYINKLGLGVVKGLKIWPRLSKGLALILYNFELKKYKGQLGLW